MPASTPFVGQERHEENSSQPAPLDPASFANLQEFLGCEDLAEVGEFLDEVLPDVDALVSSTIAAAAARDWVALKIAAHTLKSNCATVGAPEARQIAMSIEAWASAETPGPEETLVALTARLAPAYSRYRHALGRARAAWKCA